MIPRLRGLALLACVLGFAIGCSRQGKRSEDFTPPADNARKALESALNYWQSGNPPGTIPSTTPTVEVVDSKWQSGQKLKSYEILSEESGGEQRFFKVRLIPVQGQPQEVRYAVVGINPLWVYREDDYKKLSGMGK